MIDPDTEVGTLVICVDDEVDDPETKYDPKFQALVFGNLYRVCEIWSERSVRDMRQSRISRQNTEYLVCLQGIGNENDIYDAINWYSTARFVAASEYQTVIDFYHDLIRNPPENKSC